MRGRFVEVCKGALKANADSSGPIVWEVRKDRWVKLLQIRSNWKMFMV